eukprot:131568-Prorocentrum_minimum.AAC.1
MQQKAAPSLLKPARAQVLGEDPYSTFDHILKWTGPSPLPRYQASYSYEFNQERGVFRSLKTPAGLTHRVKSNSRNLP